MSSINEHLALVRKIAALRTSEEIESVEDGDLRQELREEDMQNARDALDRVVAEARALVAEHPYDFIDMSGAAIREHFEEHEKPEMLEGMSDQDLQDAGEWALNSDSLWDSVYRSWEYGIAQVRYEKKNRKGKR